MRKNFGAQPWIYPQPVLMIATYDKDGVPDIMNAAWGGISGEHQISICLSPSHKTTENILARKAFTVSMADVAHMTACDYVGLVSGKKVPDKLEKAGFHPEQSQFVDAPVIRELPMCLECRLIRYDTETGILVGDIVNISAEERILDGKGKIDPDKLVPLTFDPIQHTYRALGPIVGTAFHDGAKLNTDA